MRPLEGAPNKYKFEEDIIKLSSFQPSLINDWAVKVSTLNGVICIVMTNIHSAQTLVNFFDNETDAHKHIEYWVENQST